MFHHQLEILSLNHWTPPCLLHIFREVASVNGRSGECVACPEHMIISEEAASVGEDSCGVSCYEVIQPKKQNKTDKDIIVAIDSIISFTNCCFFPCCSVWTWIFLPLTKRGRHVVSSWHFSIWTQHNNMHQEQRAEPCWTWENHCQECNFCIWASVQKFKSNNAVCWWNSSTRKNIFVAVSLWLYTQSKIEAKLKTAQHNCISWATDKLGYFEQQISWMFCCGISTRSANKFNFPCKILASVKLSQPDT